MLPASANLLRAHNLEHDTHHDRKFKFAGTDLREPLDLRHPDLPELEQTLFKRQGGMLTADHNLLDELQSLLSRLGAAKVVMFLDDTSTADNPEWQIFVQNGDDKPTAEVPPKPKRKRKAPSPKPKVTNNGKKAGPLPFNDPIPW